MTDIPAAASAAVTEVLLRDNWSMRDVLEAAAPHIAAADPTTETEGFRAYKAGLAAGREEGAAAEREYLIRLASQLRAAITADHPEGAQASFADYLRQAAPRS